METVVIVIHLMVVLAMIAVVLLQRSEGGALGIGGGGGGGGFLTGRGAGNVLTRATAILAAAFFATSILLTVLARTGDRPSEIFDALPAQDGSQPTAPQQGGESVLDTLQRQSGETAPPAAPAAPAEEPSEPQVPSSQ